MKIHRKSIVVIAAMVTGWMCSHPDEYPLYSVSDVVPLFSSSFEANGKFSMDGWTLTDSYLSALVDSCTDTPYSISRSSIRLRRDTVTSEVPGITKTVISSRADTSREYSLSLYVKGKGTLLVRQRTEDGPRSVTFYLNGIGWSAATFSFFKARPVKDTITITFRPLNIDAIPFLIIDDVRLTYWRKNQ